MGFIIKLNVKVLLKVVFVQHVAFSHLKTCSGQFFLEFRILVRDHCCLLICSYRTTANTVCVMTLDCLSKSLSKVLSPHKLFSCLSVFSLVLVSIEKTYQTVQTVFHQLSKHLEFRQKYYAARRISTLFSALGYPDETLLTLVFGILGQSVWISTLQNMFYPPVIPCGPHIQSWTKVLGTLM